MSPEQFQHIEELFHAVLKLPPAERQAFLSSNCKDELLRKEVESLLVEDANPAGLLQNISETNQPAAFRFDIGARLGPYEISGLIGRGGMGEVYRARDTKLHRDVAVKMLPENIANNPERIARFRREAQLLASLNHPHIAAIYGLEESNRALALIMELVEGATLAEHIAARPIPLEEALELAKQIAEALEAAHEHGIIHRDLKPANVRITSEGTVKVLDFGLAKMLKADRGAADPDSAPEATPATQSGVIVGTVAYMSPEQARGAAVDKRTDIWAFGVVLYEMLTSRRLFAGDTISDTMAAVLTKEPDWDRVPVKVRRLLRRCLEKDPKRRLRDIADAWPLLDESSQPGPAKRNLRPTIAAALAITAALSLWMAWRTSRPRGAALQPLVRLDLDLGNDVSLGSERGTDVILSPDGSRLIYVSQSRLFTRRLDQPKAVELVGTEGAHAPFFSPDGQWVAFFTQRKLKKISMQGGPAIELCEAPIGDGGSWGEDGNIIAALEVSGLSQIPSTGGSPKPITQLAPGELVHRWPQILPGGRTVLFTAYTGLTGYRANIDVMSLQDRRRKTLQRGSTWGRYLPSGHLVYMNNGTLFAVPVEPERWEVRGAPQPVLERIGYSAASGSAQLDVSPTGTAVYRTGGRDSGWVTVQWLDSSGHTKPLLLAPGNYLAPRLSPDGQRLALTSGSDIWVYDLRHETMTRLTFTGGYGNPLWTPDGRYIAFRGTGGIFWIRADGSGNPQHLVQSNNVQNPWSFSGDGKRLAFVEINPASGADLWTVAVESDGAGLTAGRPEVFLQTPFNERSPAFSPDGHWIAYASDESGMLQVYVREFPDKSGKRQISNEGGAVTAWSRTRPQLFFLNLENQVMVTAYRVQRDLFLAHKPQRWSEKKLANLLPPWAYDVAPDGKRIVAVVPAERPYEQEAQHHVTFLLNFFDELRRRVPPDSTPLRTR